MNSYSEYCKVFTKGLKTAINKHKGPCSAKVFDTMISAFVTDLYNIKPVLAHPFATEQDAYNFAYCVIFTITSTTNITMDDFKHTIGDIGGRVPEQFIQDMYTHIMERKNSSKKLAEQVIDSTTKMRQTLVDYEVIKSVPESTVHAIKEGDESVVGDSEKKADDTANSYCSVM
jgi:hypothetical protein